MEHMDEYKIPEDAVERLKDPEVIRKQMQEGKTFQEIIGFSPEKMEKFYHIAHNLFLKQEYQKAADAFIFLTTLNPYVHNYWLGLGMSEQLYGGYQGALLAYAMAIMTDVDSPVAHYHSASCYRALDDQQSALRSLDLAIQCSGNTEEHKKLKEQALSAKNALKL